MKFVFNRMQKKCLGMLLVIAMLLMNACSSGPTPIGDSVALSDRATPLATKDQRAYANALSDLEKGDAKTAASALAKITNTNPGYFDGWINLAIANCQLKDFETAKRALVHAHKLQPTSAQLNNIRALISTEDGHYKDAEQLYLASLKLEPKNPNTHYNLALLYDIYYQNLPQAVSHYESYLSLSNQKDEETEAWTEELKQKLQQGSTQ